MSRLVDRAALSGKVAAVLGGGYGIGTAITLALAGEGVAVFIGDADEDSLEATRGAAEALGVRAEAALCDVTEQGAVERFFAMVGEQAERLDIVVNVAGGTRRRRFEDGDAAQDVKDIQLNFGYVIQSVRAALPLLRRSGEGASIVNFTTIEAHRGAATFSVYAGAKAATTNFSRAMAVELGAENIRVNCIAPDTTASRGNVEALDPDTIAKMMDLPDGVMTQGLEMYIPTKRAPTTDDLADAVLFLTSGLSRSITGTTVHVDGGTSASLGFLDWAHGDGFVPTPLAGSAYRMFGEA
ncbi:SDR family oxidoreductase [Novosphingobium sp. G106]|uniref:SDR family NAD(P)-dependent oxidoreductase n=1 Tax=Novosphingobium sp. G106 TaxID=2849500 RepID=UPI001C2D60B3|nr:SDR family oxidoreductase [Novosphingobium sp. G106]MBV1688962.1 SDR family oxidoreductase [Novosphingobium sp. G106]